MHSHKNILRFLIFLFLFITLNKNTFGYNEIPCLIHIPIDNQPDSFGFNLVQEFPMFVYEKIKSGELTLWDSPAKKSKIAFSALEGIEKQNNAKFTRTQSLFLNELWSSRRKKTDFLILGFSFITETSKGRIDFGYVDAQESFILINNNVIKTNVNGSANMSYFLAFYSRNYKFNLVQFGNEDFKNDKLKSIIIKDKAFNEKKKIEALYKPIEEKVITYTINKNPENDNDNGTLLIAGLENLINTNPEIIYNLGGIKYFDLNKKNGFKLSRIEVTEVWKKNNNTIIEKVQLVTLYINNFKLDPWHIKEINEYKLMVNFKSLEDILNEKKFIYIINKINEEHIPESENLKYLKGLKEYRWNQLSRYVKYF